jgi:AraC-like DNA-binding protein
MKVLPFKIPKPENSTIIFQEDKGIYFYDKLHQHEEIQISLIIEGKGTLIVGDSINYYDKGDILVIGSNIPHVFKSNTEETSNSHMQSLFFSKDSFGIDFFELQELQELKSFFKRSKHGFKIISSKKIISNLFSELKIASKFRLFTTLLELLKIASKANYKSLSSFIYEKKYTDVEGKRMQDVFDFTMKQFQNDISLSTIASVATMTKNAFCKYFKKRTNKTYFRFLNELRIEHACKLLVEEKDFSIADVAYNSGFKNISNFNRQFKTIKKVNPSDFKKVR